MPEIASFASNSSTTTKERVWTTLITNTKYLDGLLTLDYSLKRVGSKYRLVALYTDTFEKEGHDALAERGIPSKQIAYLIPAKSKDYSQDVRFYDCWSKLQPFSLVEYDKVVQLDSDMVVVQNMDELFDVPVGEDNGNGSTWAFAASHACTCNPYDKPHYPKDWVRDNCAFTNTHKSDDLKNPLFQSCNLGLGICNGGLQVVKPDPELYNKIIEAVSAPSTEDYDFADQSLLSDVFKDRWIGLSYRYNALKTLRVFHKELWDDSVVKNIHYIITPKPWDVEESEYDDTTGTFKWWWDINKERLTLERASISTPPS